ncbi:MAG: histidine kinase [Gelidibacter sp.]
MKQLYQFLSKYKVLHIIYWVYAALNHLHTLELQRGKGYLFNTYDLVKDLFFEMLAVYFVIYVLLPKFFYRQKYWQFFVLAFLTVIACSALNCLTAVIYIPIIDPTRDFHPSFILLSITFMAHFVEILTVVVLFTIVILIEYYIKKDRQNQLMERERLETELNFLKAQMNPHFLFNALNNIYFLIDGDQELSKDVLIKFSSLLRYQLYDCAVDKTPLSDEIGFLKDYISLEKIRHTEHLTITFIKPNLEHNYQISPLLLIPFVENAFKYVSIDTDGNNYITIQIEIDERHWLHFNIKNSCAVDVTTSGNKGLGIANVKRRLELLYPNEHELHIEKLDSAYKVDLKIKLK